MFSIGQKVLVPTEDCYLIFLALQVDTYTLLNSLTYVTALDIYPYFIKSS